jgi:hypothetical protein
LNAVGKSNNRPSSGAGQPGRQHHDLPPLK